MQRICAKCTLVLFGLMSKGPTSTTAIFFSNFLTWLSGIGVSTFLGISAKNCRASTFVTTCAQVQATCALGWLASGRQLASIFHVVVPTNLTCCNPCSVVLELLWTASLCACLALVVVLWRSCPCRSFWCWLGPVCNIHNTLACRQRQKQHCNSRVSGQPGHMLVKRNHSALHLKAPIHLLS